MTLHTKWHCHEGGMANQAYSGYLWPVSISLTMKMPSFSLENSLFFKLGLFSLIILSHQSCKKGDKGDQGPAGTANVIYSEWFTPNPYVKDTVFGIWGFKYDKAVAEITQAILDSGAVLTYAKLSGYNPTVWPAQQVAPMPIQLTYISGSTMTDTWSALSTVGNLRIRFTNSANYYTSISNTHQFRYIIIPGGKKGTLGLGVGTNTIENNAQNNSNALNLVLEYHDQMNYDEVCRLLNIEK